MKKLKLGVYIIKYAPNWWDLPEQYGRLRHWVWKKLNPKKVSEIQNLADSIIEKFLKKVTK